MCKLAYLGIILKADWNVLGVHNKLFYCSTILETSFPPPPSSMPTSFLQSYLTYICIILQLKAYSSHYKDQKNIAFPADITVLLEFVSVTSQRTH